MRKTFAAAYVKIFISKFEKKNYFNHLMKQRQIHSFLTIHKRYGLNDIDQI